MKYIRLIVALLLITTSIYSGHSGIFFDDPVAMSIQGKPQLLGKDQLAFAPTGKHQDLWIVNANYTVEITYATHTTSFTVYRGWVNSRDPLLVEVPGGLKGITKVTLTAKWKSRPTIWRLKENIVPPKNATPEELVKYIEPVKGLKVDTTWNMK